MLSIETLNQWMSIHRGQCETRFCFSFLQSRSRCYRNRITQEHGSCITTLWDDQKSNGIEGTNLPKQHTRGLNIANY